MHEERYIYIYICAHISYATLSMRCLCETVEQGARRNRLHDTVPGCGHCRLLHPGHIRPLTGVAEVETATIRLIVSFKRFV